VFRSICGVWFLQQLVHRTPCPTTSSPWALQGRHKDRQSEAPGSPPQGPFGGGPKKKESNKAPGEVAQIRDPNSSTLFTQISARRMGDAWLRLAHSCMTHMLISEGRNSGLFLFMVSDSERFRTDVFPEGPHMSDLGRGIQGGFRGYSGGFEMP
jgi:hypothetical protein